MIALYLRATLLAAAMVACALVLAHAAPPEGADSSLAPWYQGLKQTDT